MVENSRSFFFWICTQTLFEQKWITTYTFTFHKMISERKKKAALQLLGGQRQLTIIQ